VDYGPSGQPSGLYPEQVTIAISEGGQPIYLVPQTQMTSGPVDISADGGSLVLRADDYSTEAVGEPGVSGSVLEIMRRGEQGWTTSQVVAMPSSGYQEGQGFEGVAGFAGGDAYYFFVGTVITAEGAPGASDDTMMEGTTITEPAVPGPTTTDIGLSDTTAPGVPGAGAVPGDTTVLGGTTTPGDTALSTTTTAAPVVLSRGHVRLGVLDPETGECQLFAELPVDCKGGVGLWSQPLPVEGETPDDGSATTTPSGAPGSSPAILQAAGSLVFSAAWGTARGQFGVERDQVYGGIMGAPNSFWVGADERLYILDRVNGRVQVVGADGSVESVIGLQTDYPSDVAAAPDGTVLVTGSAPGGDGRSVVQAYGPSGGLRGQYIQTAADVYPLGFVADETTVYCVCQTYIVIDEMAGDYAYINKYVPVYRDGELLDPWAGWDTGSYDQPLSGGLSLRVGDHAPGAAVGPEPTGSVHVYSADGLVFSAAVPPSDYGMDLAGVIADDGRLLVTRTWLMADVSSIPEPAADDVWVFSAGGSPLGKVSVLHTLRGLPDGIRCISRLSPAGALYQLTWTSDRLSVVRYDLNNLVQMPALPAQMPGDFQLRAAFGSGGSPRNCIDTEAGTCTKDLIDGGVASTRLRLTPAELQELYRDLVDMDITEYDSHFHPGAGDSRFQPQAPYDTYWLSLEIGGATAKFVYWEDNLGATSAEAVALREWFARLQQMIEAKPEWQALPPVIPDE
jgi:hypothetical protein